MAGMDIEMQDQDVPCTVVDATELEKDQNPSEMPKPILKESGGSGDVDGQGNGHGKKGDVGVVNHSERRTRTKVQFATPETETETGDENPKKRKTWLLDNSEGREVDVAGTPEEQQMFLRELETFHRENFLEYKPLKFYGQPLNSLKLWRAVINLGGYDVVTTNKLWRQVGESFHPPKTCTTVSYTFRNFYEKALLEYEKYLRKNGDLHLPGSTDTLSSSLDKEVVSNQGSGSGRARRDSAARAMQGWHAQRQAGSGEDKGFNFTPKQKKLKHIGVQKPNTQASLDPDVPNEEDTQSSVADIVDDGPLADWVKITVKETKEAFEVFALIPGLLRDEVRIQSDPAGKLIITGQPEQLDNPWGITPFKKIVGLSARINPLQTNAIMSMHGRLFIRVPYEK
uniref:AT-rich interactive domain-containing protein 6 n=1 Tax=Noccaea caerulescens TaxID=107243 RepID=A0A1J3D7L2_NOCCA